MRRIIAAASTLVLTMLAGVFAVPVAQAGDPCFHDTSRPPVTEGSATTVKIDNCVFLPTIARVPVGTTVRFVNSGFMPHQVTGANLTWGISGDEKLAPDAELKARFDKAGVYPYSCMIHPGMTGAIIVGAGAASGGGGGTVADAAGPAVGAAGAGLAGAGAAGAESPAADGTGLVPAAAVATGVLALGLLGSAVWFGRRRHTETRLQPD
jgi:plastocyanin